jgi:hypothetical protein
MRCIVEVYYALDSIFENTVFERSYLAIIKEKMKLAMSEN